MKKNKRAPIFINGHLLTKMNSYYEENKDSTSKSIAALTENNNALRRRNDELQKCCSHLQKKSVTKINKLKRLVHDLQTQNSILNESVKLFEKENFPSPSLAPNQENNSNANFSNSKYSHQQPVHSEKEENFVLLNRLKNAESEIHSLREKLKLYKNKSNRNSNANAIRSEQEQKDFEKDLNFTNKNNCILMKKENDRLKKLIDQKELEVTVAETTINEQKLEIESLKSALKEKQSPPKTVSASPLSKQTENFNNNNNNDNNNKTADEKIESALSVFEEYFGNESEAISELTNQRNRLTEIVLLLEKVADLNLDEICKKYSEKQTNENRMNSKLQSRHYSQSLNIIYNKIKSLIEPCMTDSLRYLFSEEEEEEDNSDSNSKSVEEKIIYIVQKLVEKNNKSHQKPNKYNFSNKEKRNVDESDDSSDDFNKRSQKENIDMKDKESIILGHLRNSLDFIQSLTKIEKFKKETVLAKCAEIENFINTQVYDHSSVVVSLFKKQVSVSSQINAFFEIVSESDIENKRPLRELYTLFEIVLTVNSLLFSRCDELTVHYQKVLSEKEKAEIGKNLNDKNHQERLNYLSSKLSAFLKRQQPQQPPSIGIDTSKVRKTSSVKFEKELDKIEDEKELEEKGENSPKSFEDDVDLLCAELVRTKTLLKNEREKSHRLQSTIDELFEADNIKKRKIYESQKKITELQKEYDKEKAKNTNIKQKMRDELDCALEGLERGCLLEKEVTDLTEKVEKLKAKKVCQEQLEIKLRAAERERNDLLIKLTAAQCQIQRLTTAEETAVLLGQEITEKADQLKEKNDILKKENDDLHGQIRSEISELRNRNIRLEKEYKNNMETLTLENDKLKAKYRDLLAESSKIDETKRESMQNIAKAKLEGKNAALQLSECQNALKSIKCKYEDQISIQKESFEKELSEKKKEIEKCKNRFLDLFTFSKENDEPETKLDKDDQRKKNLFTLINEFVSFYDPIQIYDYKKSKKALNLSQNDTLSKSCRSLMKNMQNINESITSKQSEINRQKFEIIDLAKKVTECNEEIREKSTLIKWIKSLYMIIKSGQLPPQQFSVVLSEIEEAAIDVFTKPDNHRNKIEILRIEKKILNDSRIQCLSVGSKKQKGPISMRSVRPLAIVVLFARKMAEQAGKINKPYVPNK